MFAGEWDWMNRLPAMRGSGGFGGVFGPPPIGNGGVMGGPSPMGNPTADARMAFAAQLLAGSGPSPVRKSFGQLVGEAMQAGQLAKANSQDNALRKQYTDAQIGAMNRPEQRKPVAVAGKDGKPVYVDEASAIGQTPWQPGRTEATPDSIQEFQFAQQQGFNGSYDQWLARKASMSRAPVQGGGAPETRQTDRGLMQWDPQKQQWSLVPGTEPQGVSGRPMPGSMATDFQEDANALNLIDNVLTSFDPENHSPEAKAAKSAVGKQNIVFDAIDAVIPGDWSQTMKNAWDPNGTQTRSFLANLNSIQIKNRSGAAVTVAEFARNAGFLPLEGDKPEVVHTKLVNLRKAIADLQQYRADFATSQGYRLPPLSVNQRGASGSWEDASSPTTPTGGGWSAAKVSK